MPGCQEESGISGRERPPLPVMVPFEGPGFKLEIPENWEASIVGNKVVARPGESRDEAEFSLVLEPYTAGETPQAVIDGLMETRFRIKGGKKPVELEVSGFPALRQYYTSDGSNRSPDRILFVLATPAGKLTILAALKNSNDISKYITNFLSVVDSVRI